MSKFHQIIRYPVITEKSTKMRSDEHDDQGDQKNKKKKCNKYVFKVALDATKTEIKEAVHKALGVELEAIEAVNTMIVKGKKKRQGRSEGYSPDWKKAIVRLKAGHVIDKLSISV